MITAAETLTLTFERPDDAHAFEDPAVPAGMTVEEVTRLAAPRLRYPLTDASSGRALKYSMLHDGVELPKDEPVGRALPLRRARVHIVNEYENAHGR